MTHTPSTPVLQVRELSVQFKQGTATTTAVERISFDLHRGETVALVGESGSGKSVTALSILKLLPYPAASHPSGEILFEGEDLLQLRDQRMQAIRGNRIGMIFQEPMTALNPLHTIEKQLGEVICQHRNIKRRQARPLVIELLNQVQIPEPESRLNNYPHELSGGQRQRVMIAMALANEPQILIADEPTTALDVTVQKEILELLAKLQTTRGLSMLFITHDLGVVRHCADRVVVMKNGLCVEHGDVDAVFTNPQNNYTQELLNAVPSQRPDPVVTTNAEPLLAAENISVEFALSKTLLGKPKRVLRAVNRVSVELYQGETLGIVGESGSGKSTLAMALLRLTASDGSITFDRKPLQPLSQKQLRPLRRDLQVVFQDPFASLSPRMTIGQIISEGLLVHEKLPEEAVEAQVVEVMNEVNIDASWRHRYPHELSGGQRQRVAIARALILNPRLLVLDEPTSALDRSVQHRVIDLLAELQQKRGLSYLFISHDLQVVRALSHRVMVMRGGEVVESGLCQDIFENPSTDYTRALINASLLT